MRCPLCEVVAVDGLCADHLDQLHDSEEGRRISAIEAERAHLGLVLPREDRARCRVALVDYVRRVQAERANVGAR